MVTEIENTKIKEPVEIEIKSVEIKEPDLTQEQIDYAKKFVKPLIYYLGSRAGIICGMPSDSIFDIKSMYNPFKSQKQVDLICATFEEFLNNDNTKNYPYLTAITTQFQKKSNQILKNNGFREVKQFYSSHGKHEVLTLLTKTQENCSADFDFNQLHIINYSLNCSISTNRGHIQYKCIINTQKENETYDFMKKTLKYSRIKDTPIWFLIKPEDLVVKKD